MAGRGAGAPPAFCAKANGLPSESRQIAHSSPGCTTAPPLALTRSSVGDQIGPPQNTAARTESPGPRPADVHTNPRAHPCRVCQPSPFSVAARLQLKRPTRPTRTAARARGRRRETRSRKHERAERPQPYPAVPPQGGCAHGRSGARGTPGCPRAPSSSRPTVISAAAETPAPTRRVEQLSRRLERIRHDSGAMAGCRGVLAAQAVQPRARVLARGRRHHSGWPSPPARWFPQRPCVRSAPLRGRFGPDLGPRRASVRARARCAGRRGRC